jgi:hypothetical protein
MSGSIKAALFGLALAGGTIAAGHVAMADSVTISTTTTSGPAFGYSDGYWDRAHAWKSWASPEESTKWRTENTTHYYERKHDSEKDNDGWRETDHYWVEQK